MWKGWKGGNKKERKIVQGVKRKKRRKIIYCGKVRKVETPKKKIVKGLEMKKQKKDALERTSLNGYDE